MKRFLSGRFLPLLVALGCAGVMSSCGEEEATTKDPVADLIEVAASVDKTITADEKTTPKNVEFSITFGSTEAVAETTFTVAAGTETDLQVYNVMNGTDYTMLPSNNYSLLNDAEVNYDPADAANSSKFGFEFKVTPDLKTGSYAVILNVTSTNPLLNTDDCQAVGIVEFTRTDIVVPEGDIIASVVGTSGAITSTISLNSITPKTVKLKLHFSDDVTAQNFTVGVKGELVADYNGTQGANYTAIPAGNFEFAATTIAYDPLVSTSAEVSITITGSETLAVDEYLIPITITAADNPDDFTYGDMDNTYFLVVDYVEATDDTFKGEGMPRGILYMEVNQSNPLNALTFEFEDGTLLWDAVILFASNVNNVGGKENPTGAPVLFHNDKVSYYLANVDKYIRPLQARGVKVLMGLLNNHQAAGMAKFSPLGAKLFAQQVVNDCMKYGLDGVDFNDEYAGYGGGDSPYLEGGSSSRAYCLRLMAETRLQFEAAGKFDAIISTFDYGSAYGATEAVDVLTLKDRGETITTMKVEDIITVVTPNYGSRPTAVGGLTKKNVAAHALEFNGGSSAINIAAYQGEEVDRYGWFMGFALMTPGRRDQSIRDNLDASYNRMKPMGEIYGVELKEPTFYYDYDGDVKQSYKGRVIE